MSIKSEFEGGTLIVSTDQRLDTNTAPEAEKVITNAIENGSCNVVMNFSDTDYISSAGLRVILKSAKLLKPKQGIIVLCNANEQITEVLEISGFSGLVKIFNTLDEAMSAFN